MKKITINRKIWLHGRKQVNNSHIQKASMLYRSTDRKMCCIGIYLNQCGISKKVLLDKSDAVSLTDEDIKLPKQAKWLINVEQNVYSGVYTSNTGDAGHLMQINDSTANEKKIKRMFAKHDVEIEFIGRS